MEQSKVSHPELINCPKCGLTQDVALVCKMCGRELNARGEATETGVFVIQDINEYSSASLTEKSHNKEAIKSSRNQIVQRLKNTHSVAHPIKQDESNKIYKEMKMLVAATALNSYEKSVVLQNAFDEIFGFGPLGPILRDPYIVCAFIDDPQTVRVLRMDPDLAEESQRTFNQPSEDGLLKRMEHLMSQCPGEPVATPYEFDDLAHVERNVFKLITKVAGVAGAIEQEPDGLRIVLPYGKMIRVANLRLSGGSSETEFAESTHKYTSQQVLHVKIMSRKGDSYRVKIENDERLCMLSSDVPYMVGQSIDAQVEYETGSSVFLKRIDEKKDAAKKLRWVPGSLATSFGVTEE